MKIVDYNCPACDHTSQAPLLRFAEGDAGIWVCPDCENAFQLRVEFVRITPATIEKAAIRLSERRIDRASQGESMNQPHLPLAVSHPHD